MTNETSKTNNIRPIEFFETYLSGNVLDIGSGGDPVTPNAEEFDKEHGDANDISQFRPKEFYDCVYASHSLEHMRDPEHALSEWWKLVKVGGYIIVVVPDEDLYEQGFWPSCFNGEHKFTFTTKNKINPSPVSRNVEKIFSILPDSKILDIQIQDQGYRHFLRVSRETPFRRKLLHKYRQACIKHDDKQSLNKVRLGVMKYLFNFLGMPIDQTQLEALAQIQCVIRKIAPS